VKILRSAQQVEKYVLKIDDFLQKYPVVYFYKKGQLSSRYVFNCTVTGSAVMLAAEIV